MKKVYALILTLMMLFSMSVMTSAEISPTGNKVTEEESDKSPKTGDMNIAVVGAAGVVCAAAAVAAAKKSRVQA